MDDDDRGAANCGSRFGMAKEAKGMLPEFSGNSWSGWKFSHMFCEMGGELRVTRNRSGGLLGTEKDGLKGVGGLVMERDVRPPMSVSVVGRGGGAEVTGRAGAPMTVTRPCACPAGSRGGIGAGVCGRDRSYETWGVGGPLEKGISISSNLRLGGSSCFAPALAPLAILLCLSPAAFCSRSSSFLLPRMYSNSVWTIFATSHTLETSLRASMHL